MCHVLTLPIQHIQMWISCQNHKHTCNWLLAPLSFLCIYVAYELVRPRGHEPHQSHQCNPNHCHKNTLWNLQRVFIININWIKLNQDTKITKYLEMWPISIRIENMLWHIRKCRINKLYNILWHNIAWQCNYHFHVSTYCLTKHRNLSWSILLHMSWPSTTNVIAQTLPSELIRYPHIYIECSMYYTILQKHGVIL